MATLGSILNTARSSIFANQAGARVASENIANAQTEGYSRKRADIVQAPVARTALGRLGTGVMIDGIARVRDSLLDRAYRVETGKASGYEMRQSLVGRIEEVFGEPSETGLSATLDAFWRSWSELANQPASDIAQKLVRQSGQRVATMLRDFSGRLDELADAARVRLDMMARDVSGIARQIGDLNQAIQIARGEGDAAPDLRDQLDRLVDRLTEFGSVRVIDRENGSFAVLFEDAPLVDGSSVKALEVSGAPPAVTAGTTTLDFDGAPGALGEVVGVLTRDLPAAQAALDELAAGLVAKTNEVHRQGFTQDGVADIDFFDADPASASAKSIRLSAAVAADHTQIVASSQAGPDGDNEIALRMISLRDDVTTMAGGTTSFQGFYRGLVTDVAARIHGAESSASVYRTLASQVENRRQSVSGVSIDEELIRLTQHQQAYMAATKVVTAVDEMMQSLLNIV